MTRFFVKIGCEDIIKRLIRYCEKENYAYRVNEFGVVSRHIMRSIAMNSIENISWEYYKLLYFTAYSIDNRSTKNVARFQSKLYRDGWKRIGGLPLV